MSDTRPLILIVEDDEEMAQFNARLLLRKGYDSLVAHTAAEARKLFMENKFDLYVLDVTLPDGDGLSLCGEFRRKSDAPVLFLTGKSESEDKVKGLDSGGDYYLTKPYDKLEFLAVVKCLLRWAEQMQKKIDEVISISKGSLTLKFNEKKAYINGKDAELSPKEFAILLLFIQNENQDLTYEQIYKIVWGADMNNDSNALRHSVSRLKKKIDEENADDFAIINKQGVGYSLNFK
jgi:DNA-binding response OmpR family regulator